MKVLASDVIAQFEAEAESQGVSWRALGKARAAAEGITEHQFYVRILRSGGTVRLLESARTLRPQQLLEKVFKSLGHNAKGARVAAAGRSGLSEASAAKNAAGLGPDAYAYAPDESDPSTWLLQLYRDKDSKSPEPSLVQYAVSHLPGIAAYGTAVAIPDKDLDAVKARLRSAWIAARLSIDDLPLEMQQLELAASMRRLGITSTVGLRAALRGRPRRH
jgi:hypothetical protein